MNSEGPASLGGGRRALAELLDGKSMGGSVIFCSSDQFAQGILVEAAARGLSVPRDVAVIGFGDQEFAASTEPALTSVRVDRDLLGRVAADALLNRFRTEPGISPVHNIGFEIIRRDTA